jgi:hypothetical protein
MFDTAGAGSALSRGRGMSAMGGQGEASWVQLAVLTLLASKRQPPLAPLLSRRGNGNNLHAAIRKGM